MLVELPGEHPPRTYDVPPVSLLSLPLTTRVRLSFVVLVYCLLPDDKSTRSHALSAYEFGVESSLAGRVGRGGIIVRRSLVEEHMAYTLLCCHQRQHPMPRTLEKPYSLSPGLSSLHNFVLSYYSFLTPRRFPPCPTPLHMAVLRARDIRTKLAGSPLRYIRHR